MIHRWKKQEERGDLLISANPPTHPTAFWLDALSGAIGAWCSQGSRTTSLWSRPPSFSQSVVTTRDLLFPQRTGYIYATCLLWLPYYKIQSSLQNWSSTTTIHISIVSVCIGSQKKKRNTKFLDECVQECRVFIPLLNFSQQIQGVGEEGRYTFARRSQRSRVVAEQLPFSAARQIIGCFSLYTIFLLPGSWLYNKKTS